MPATSDPSPRQQRLSVTPTKPSNLRLRHKSPSKNALVWGSLFLFLGMALFALGAWSAAQGIATNFWPRANATLVDIEVTTFKDTDPHGQDAFFQSNKNSFYVTLNYTYRFEGRDYSSAGIQRGAFGSQNAALARKLAGSLNRGATISVVVNPADPSEAYLAPGVSGIAYIAAGVGLVILLIGGRF